MKGRRAECVSRLIAAGNTFEHLLAFLSPDQKNTHRNVFIWKARTRTSFLLGRRSSLTGEVSAPSAAVPRGEDSSGFMDRLYWATGILRRTAGPPWEPWNCQPWRSTEENLRTVRTLAWRGKMSMQETCKGKGGRRGGRRVGGGGRGGARVRWGFQWAQKH